MLDEKRPIKVEVNIQPYPAATPPPPLNVEDDDPRRSKELDLAQAVERYVPDNIESLAIGGMHMHNNPMGLVRELIRQSKHIKRLITSPSGSINADLLIGAGLVDEVVTPYIGFEHLGLAPAFRRLAQSGQLKVYEIDEITLMTGLRAGAANQPFITLPPGLEFSDVSRTNSDFYRKIVDPFSGRLVLAAPALKPQITFLCAQQADKLGNLLLKGSVFLDREMALASDITLVQTEQLVTNTQLTHNPQAVSLASYYVTAVVKAPFSCHPTASHRLYHYDENHLKEYLQLAATAEGFETYLDKYIRGGTELEYLAKTAIAS